MELYYGICLIVVVTTICVGFGAGIFYRSILTAIDNYKDSRAKKTARVISATAQEVITKLKPIIDEAIKKEKKAKEEMYKYRKEIYGEKE